MRRFWSLLFAKPFVIYKHVVSLNLHFSSISSKMNVPIKSPNVLVYTGEGRENVFKSIADNLLRCLHRDRYVVYELKKAQVLETPWKENTALLVVFCEEIEDSISDSFRQYFENDGKILLFCSNFELLKVDLKSQATSKDSLIKINYKGEENIPVWRGKYTYSSPNSVAIATDSDKEPVIVKVMRNKSILIASEVYLAHYPSFSEPSEAGRLIFDAEKLVQILECILDKHLELKVSSLLVPKPTAGYVIAEHDKLPELENTITIREIPLVKLDPVQTRSCGELTLLNTDLKVPLSFGADTTLFDKSAYFAALKTNQFGRVVVFFPVITSTQIAAEHLSDHDGIVVIASQQICGRGRGDNVWISPEGCAMFTLHFTLTLSSQLGQKLSVLQHLASVAVVNSIRKMPSYSKIDLRVKWPNDIYFEKDKKIGGVLVNTTIQGNVVHAYVGIGVNVCNHCPSVCINSAIEAQNQANGNNLALLKIEEVVAYTLTELECLMEDFEKSGPKNFFFIVLYLLAT